ncbi:sensor histidine kinase [Lactiplantibacillus mudanjiangensis]|uniref:sensor histidine kinase n=1 Tax=Lactiplantibacillus mudanjiangensis TaxID=1296538 RepID=UPI001CDD8498|nr:GHKL domain-containing protein [Lactiplantibacillus mudanjiangensis]
MDTRAYIFQLLIEIIFFYLFFLKISMDQQGTLNKWLGILCVPLIFILNINFGFIVYLIYIVLLYIINYRFKLVVKGLNLLLFSYLSLLLVTFVSDALLSLVSNSKLVGWGFTLSRLLVEAIFLMLINLCLRDSVNRLFENENFKWLLVTLQSGVILIFFLYIELADQIGVYNKFSIGTLIFASIELLFLLGLFISAYLSIKRHYESQIKQQQLDNLRTYTEQLEQSQMELRKFRHDYKNMLLSLAELAQIGDVEKVRHYLDDLQLYSNQELSEITDNYQDIGNVNEIHMKSILLNKFFMFEHNHVDFRFECRRPVHSLTIKSFDMVRLLSITLDNAMEAVGHETDGMITIMIFQDTDSLNITIENTGHDQVGNLKQLRKPGVTTKEKHSGLGLSIIDDIRRKYSNVFVVYKSSPKKFTVQITINDSKEEG